MGVPPAGASGAQPPSLPGGAPRARGCRRRPPKQRAAAAQAALSPLRRGLHGQSLAKLRSVADKDASPARWGWFLRPPDDPDEGPRPQQQQQQQQPGAAPRCRAPGGRGQFAKAGFLIKSFVTVLDKKTVRPAAAIPVEQPATERLRWRHRLHVSGADPALSDVLDRRGLRATVGKSAAQLARARRRSAGPPECAPRSTRSPGSAGGLAPDKRAAEEHRFRARRWLALCTLFTGEAPLRKATGVFGHGLVEKRAWLSLHSLLYPLLRRRLAAQRRRRQREQRRRKMRIMVPTWQELSGAPLLADWGRPLLEDVSRSLQHVFVPCGQAVYYEGDPGDGLYYISTGAVELFQRPVKPGKGRKSRKPQPGAHGMRMRPGFIFGEAAVLAREARKRTAWAVEDCDLFKLPLSAFNRLWEKLPPEVAERLASVSASRRAKNLEANPLTAEAVGRSPLLKELSVPVSHEVKAKIAELAEPLCIPAGHRLVEEGAAPTHMMYLVAGTVTSHKSIGGKRRDRLLSTAASTRGAQVYLSAKSTLGAAGCTAALCSAAIGALKAAEELVGAEQALRAVSAEAERAGFSVTQDKWLEWCELLTRFGCLGDALDAVQQKVRQVQERQQQEKRAAEREEASKAPASEAQLKAQATKGGGQGKGPSKGAGQLTILTDLLQGAHALPAAAPAPPAPPASPGERKEPVAEPGVATRNFFELKVDKICIGSWLCATAGGVVEAAPMAHTLVAATACDLWAIDHLAVTVLLREHYPAIWQDLCRDRPENVRWMRPTSPLQRHGTSSMRGPNARRQTRTRFCSSEDGGADADFGVFEKSFPFGATVDLWGSSPLLPEAQRSPSVSPGSDGGNAGRGAGMRPHARVQTPDGWGFLGFPFDPGDPDDPEVPTLSTTFWWVRLDTGGRRVYPERDIAVRAAKGRQAEGGPKPTAAPGDGARGPPSPGGVSQPGGGSVQRYRRAVLTPTASSGAAGRPPGSPPHCRAGAATTPRAGTPAVSYQPLRIDALRWRWGAPSQSVPAGAPQSAVRWRPAARHPPFSAAYRS
eukprot:TRINITY_DN1395_c2_g1_i1.p1 TRINITY_DN1395_c2_g1~~TRINITY_DN1395_c2_g1_i1.p1  ORF type:complete len:1066 (+),score=279.41 TRINITY_DN1395_c2_g1_i1:67-3198(+)